MAVLVGVTLEGSGAGSYLALDIPAAVISLALIALLRRWPVQFALLLSALAAVSPVATPPATLAALIVARWRPRPVALAVAGAGIGAHLIRGAWRPVAGLPYGWWAVLVCVAYAAIVGWGMLMRANQSLISSLRDRAERAEADQARRVAEARAAERTRIAREMHDVLAHRLSLLATYAGALAYRPDAPPEQLSRAAEVIRSGAHQALDELREVIGVRAAGRRAARPDGRPAQTARRDAMRPVPGMADLPRLIEESRAAGMRIDGGRRGVASWGTGRRVYGGPGLRHALRCAFYPAGRARADGLLGGAGGADERAQAQRSGRRMARSRSRAALARGNWTSAIVNRLPRRRRRFRHWSASGDGRFPARSLPARSQPVRWPGVRRCRKVRDGAYRAERAA